MRKTRFTEHQIITILKEVEKGRAVKDVCREQSVSEATYYQWKSKYGGMEASDIKRSITAEFTPRVRLAHQNFTRKKIQPMINNRSQKALLVRVTGLLLFDSELFIRNPLVRVNNWEIHPVLKLEVCQTGNKCNPVDDSSLCSHHGRRYRRLEATLSERQRR